MQISPTFPANFTERVFGIAPRDAAQHAQHAEQATVYVETVVQHKGSNRAERRRRKKAGYNAGPVVNKPFERGL